MIEISSENAKKILGHNVDRRFNYYVHHDCPDYVHHDLRECVFEEAVVFILDKYTTVCYGCCDDREYSSTFKGSGCNQCGYQGRVIDYRYIGVKWNEKVFKNIESWI